VIEEAGRKSMMETKTIEIKIGDRVRYVGPYGTDGSAGTVKALTSQRVRVRYENPPATRSFSVKNVRRVKNLGARG
jgi:hypothetical protein